MNIDDVIAKIKKAVRLARGTTEAGERDAAIRLAKNLADKNGLAFESIEAEAGIDSAQMIIDPKQERLSGCEISFAATIIREHFGLVMMQNQYRNPNGGSRYQWVWFGTKINIDIARYVFHVLIRESRRGWRDVRRKFQDMGLAEINKVCGKGAKASFMRGFFSSVYRRLGINPLRNDRERFLAEKKAANDKFEAFKKSHEVKDSGPLRDSDKLDATAAWLGAEAGDRVSLARPCGNDGSGNARLLK